MLYCLQGNKVMLHRDHNWDIFGVLLADPEVRFCFSQCKLLFVAVHGSLCETFCNGTKAM